MIEYAIFAIRRGIAMRKVVFIFYSNDEKSSFFSSLSQCIAFLLLSRYLDV